MHRALHTPSPPASLQLTTLSPLLSSPSLPPVRRTALEHPSVYAVGLYYQDLNVTKMLKWIGMACIHSAFVFWIPYGAYSGNGIDGQWGTDGAVDGLAVAGFTTFSCLVWGMQLSVAEQTLTWTWLNWLMLAISMVGWYIFCFLYGSLSTVTPEFFNVTIVAMSRPAYYLTILASLGLQALYDFTVEAIRTQIFPDAGDIARELDAGFGAGKDAVWGDEETEDERFAAASAMVDAAADPSLSSGSSPKGSGAAGAGTPHGGQQPSSIPTSKSSDSASSKANGTSIVNTLRASSSQGEQPRAISPPPLPALPKETHAPRPTPVAGGKGKAVSSSEHHVFVPKEAIMGGATEDERAAMGIKKPGEVSRFDYSNAQTKEVGSGSVPDDGEHGAGTAKARGEVVSFR